MLAILGLGTGELIVILVVVLVLFGAKRIPEFAKGLGKGINEFKKASREVTDEIHNAGNETAAPKTPPANTTPQQTPANPTETKVI